MSKKVWSLTALGAALCALAAMPALGRPPQDDAKDKMGIQKSAEGFIAAFDKGDAKALAGFWTPDGDYTDQANTTLRGRAAIEKAFAALFAEQKGLKVRIDSNSLKFLTPDVAIEDGTTEVIAPTGEPPSRARFTNILVKKDGQWYLSSVRDSAYSPPSNYENLRSLEWAVGNWAEEGNKSDVARASFFWAPNHGFLIGTHATTFKDIALGGGTQWIGWDPSAKSMRSWTFDNNGGFSEGAWTREGASKWIINTRAMLQDGKKMVSTTVITRVDPDTFTWLTKDRTVDGEVVPDRNAVTFKRQK